MPTLAPTTEHKTVAESEGRLPELVDFVHGGKDRRVVVERDGAPVAALISFDDLEWFELLLQQRVKRFAVLDRIGQAFEGVPAEEIEREADKAIAEVRAEMRAEREQAAMLAR